MVNANLVHDYGGDSIRRVKTDKVDALKIAGYCLDKWTKLSQYTPEEEIRKSLKSFNRQLNEYIKIRTILKNNLISFLDQTFPGADKLFSSPARQADSHEKWIDFVHMFWHCECISSLSLRAFTAKYEQWCRKNKYHFSSVKADNIYTVAIEHLAKE